jgi:hypothetical protein
MRIIKGYIKLYDFQRNVGIIDTIDPRNFIFDYNSNQPLQLPPCGCIISMAIENASSQPLPPTVPVTMSISLCQPPNYDPYTGVWIIRDNTGWLIVIEDTNILTFNSGIVSNLNIVYPPACNFLLANFIFNSSLLPEIIPIPKPTLNVTILLINA